MSRTLGPLVTAGDLFVRKKRGQVMKCYRISIFGGDERSSVEVDLRPTELKTVERVARLFLEAYEGLDGELWIDVEEV